MRAAIEVVWAGRQDYLPTWELQRGLAAARRADLIGDTLLLVEHPPTYTVGKRGTFDNLLIDDDRLTALGARRIAVDRGGDITFHGPGQLVAYLIRDLGRQQRRVREYVWQLEEMVIRTAAAFGVVATHEPGLPGAWVGRDKLAALGIAIHRGVTYHGVALNVDPDLRYFDYMIPCGLPGRGATSFARELGRSLSVRAAIAPLEQALAEVFEVRVERSGDLDRLRARCGVRLELVAADHPEAD